MALIPKLTIAAALLGAGALVVWSNRDPQTSTAPALAGAAAVSGAAVEHLGPRSGEPTPGGTRAAPARSSEERGAETGATAADSGVEVDLAVERRAEVAPGAIEGLVVRGTVPLDGGHVDFAPGYHTTLPNARAERLARVADGALTRVAIGADGRFALAGLTAGWYTVGVDTTETRNLPRGAHAGVGPQFDVEVRSDASGRRLVIELGAASIRGHVYDDEGRPAVGAVVGLGRPGSGDARSGVWFSQTDAEGRYAFHDLLPEVYGIHLAHHADGRVADAAWQLLDRLGRDEERIHDLGAPWRAVVWRGRVLHPDGLPLARRGSLGLRQLDTGAYEEAALETLGDFELRVRPGRYEARARVSTSDSGFLTDSLSLGEVNVPEADFERDLTLPAATVRGRITGMAPDALPPGLDLQLYRAEEARPVQQAGVWSDGAFVLYAVPPGEYRVDLWPGVTAGPAAALTVREGDEVLTVEVPVAPR